MTCKGICEKYRARKAAGINRYLSGQKRCQICDLFIQWDTLWCPCCGYRLRTKPRGGENKRRFRQDMEAKK